MGIRPWYSRTSLPGAGASPALDFKEPEPAIPIAAPTRAPQPSAPSTNDRQRVSRLRDIRQTVSREAESNEEDVDRGAPRPAVEQESTEEFSKEMASSFLELEGVTCRLGFWWVQNWCLVSPLSQEISDDVQSALARRILSAIGGEEANEQHLSWPPFSKRSVVRHEGAELGALLAKMSDDTCRGRHVLMLGLDERFIQRGDAIRDALVTGSMISVAGPALSEMAANPEHKRALWSRLREVFRESA